MKLAKYIANLGYGTRREVEKMFGYGRVTLPSGAAVGVSDSVDHYEIRIDGLPLDPPPGSVVLLHKPVGYVCSTNDVNPTIYDLLPSRFAARSPIMAPVGRLDLDTSGLLLMTDDGQMNHRITSPNTHLSKVYDATLASDISMDAIDLFAAGTMLLNGEDSPVKRALLEVMDARHVRVTITEGRYHQVRRMFAAIGNHVVTLRRISVGPIVLGDIGVASWRVLSDVEMTELKRVLLSPDRP